MPVFADRVKTTTTTTGNSTITLSASPVAGFQAVPSSLDGQTLGYVIESGTAFEIGLGVYTHSSLALTRGLRSSSTGSLLNLSGTSTVFLSPNTDDLQQNIIITVAGGNYLIDGTANQTMTLLPSITYRLDVSDSSVASHPLKFSTDSAVLTNSTGATAYTTGILEIGTRGTAGAYIQVKLEQDAPTLYYYCSSHAGMGGNVSQGGTSYTLPTASSSVLGGVKVGSGLQINAGVLSAVAGGGTDYSVTAYTASAGDTTFNASSSPALPAYSPGRIAAYINGVKRNDITATNGTSVVFGTALLAGDIVEIVNHGSGNVVLPTVLGTAGQAIKVNAAGNALEFGAAGGVSNVGTLTKTFSQNEETSITLSASVSPVPVVSVFKEMPSETVSSKGNWDVNSSGSNYVELNLATSGFGGATLTPSAVGNGTFTLSSGSFSSSDIGKRVTGNGGSAIITSASGAYTVTTNFTNTNTIAAGSWYLYGTQFNADGSGATLAGFTSGFNISTATYTQQSAYSNTYNSSNLRGILFKPDGTKIFTCNFNGYVWSFDLTTAFDITTMGGGAVFDARSQATQTKDIYFKSDGLVCFLLSASTSVVYKYTLTSAYDLSTMSYASQSYTPAGNGGQRQAMTFKPDGTRFYIMHNGAADRIYQYNLSTAFDLTSASNPDEYLDVTAQDYGSLGFEFNSDGTKVFVVGPITDKIFQYELSTPYDISTASYNNVNVTVNSVTAQPYQITFKPDGTQMYITEQGSSPYTIDQYSTGSSANATGAYFPVVTSGSGQIDTSAWVDINTMVADETAGGGTLNYAISTDNHTTWKVIHNTDGVRSIVKNNSGTWQINTNATYGSETWANSTTNNELSALQEALSTSQNRMNKTQLDAVTDANHITLGSTLDLMIAPYMASAGTAPVSDGVTINYVAAAIYQEAATGTDYTARFPSSTAVTIKSLAAQNLKVRVL